MALCCPTRFTTTGAASPKPPVLDIGWLRKDDHLSMGTKKKLSRPCCYKGELRDGNAKGLNAEK